MTRSAAVPREASQGPSPGDGTSDWPVTHPSTCPPVHPTITRPSIHPKASLRPPWGPGLRAALSCSPQASQDQDSQGQSQTRKVPASPQEQGGCAHRAPPALPSLPPPCPAEMLRAKLGAGGGIDRPAWGDQLLLWLRVSRLPTPPPVTGLPGAPSPSRLPVWLQSKRSRDIPGLCPDGSKRWGTSTQHGLLSPPPNTHRKIPPPGGTSPARSQGSLPQPREARGQACKSTAKAPRQLTQGGTVSG